MITQEENHNYYIQNREEILERKKIYYKKRYHTTVSTPKIDEIEERRILKAWDGKLYNPIRDTLYCKQSIGGISKIFKRSRVAIRAVLKRNGRI